MTESTARPCLYFDGPTLKWGYGALPHPAPIVDGGPLLVGAHRLAFYEANGYLPEVVRHSCDHPACIEITHLIPGTHADNMRDREERGHTSRGEHHSTSKITEAQALAIIADTRIHRLICADYGIGDEQVRRIKNGSRWAHLHPAA